MGGQERERLREREGNYGEIIVGRQRKIKKTEREIIWGRGNYWEGEREKERERERR